MAAVEEVLLSKLRPLPLLLLRWRSAKILQPPPLSLSNFLSQESRSSFEIHYETSSSLLRLLLRQLSNGGPTFHLLLPLRLVVPLRCRGNDGLSSGLGSGAVADSHRIGLRRAGLRCRRRGFSGGLSARFLEALEETVLRRQSGF